VHDTDPGYAEIRAYCHEHLILDNPDYIKKERMGKWTGGMDQHIYLYESLPHALAVPFGCFRDVWHIVPDKNAYNPRICPPEHLEYKSGINLYPYQERAVQGTLKGKFGVLVMPCGSGKTQCGLEIIARLGGRALWLTHTHDLLTQSKERAKACYDLPPEAYGTITAGKVAIGTHITFATVQTLCKLDLTAYRDTFNVIVVDEAQHCCGSPTRVTQFYKVISSLAAYYKIGLTATPKRADGLQASMFALLGPKIHEVTRQEVMHNTCPIKVRTIETGYIPEYDAILMGDGTIDYNKLIDNMIEDDVRFEKIMSVINAIPHANPTIVLANRVKYLEDMRINYEKTGICLSGKGQSKKAKEERRKALAALNNGEIDCIFATYQLAAEGLDVPNLRYVVFATPEQNETTVIQAAGRVGRKADGKDFGTVIDFVDDFVMYRGWYSKRLRYYKKLDAKIEN
jgi:superfamily II DNA or RNA helicase